MAHPVAKVCTYYTLQSLHILYTYSCVAHCPNLSWEYQKAIPHSFLPGTTNVLVNWLDKLGWEPPLHSISFPDVYKRPVPWREVVCLYLSLECIGPILYCYFLCCCCVLVSMIVGNFLSLGFIHFRLWFLARSFYSFIFNSLWIKRKLSLAAYLFWLHALVVKYHCGVEGHTKMLSNATSGFYPQR